MEFDAGLNVVYGASDTGKSFIVDSIDFMLGGKGPLRHFVEREGYDRILLAIETLDSALARNAPIYAEIVGFGMSADAHHITQPAPEGAAAAMRKALADADATVDQVDYINAHGTGTQANDATEAAAIHQLFGSRAPHIPISSTKALHGHSIGATGALEALATILALGHGRLPANAGVTQIDPALNLDVILHAPRETSADLALSNSLAFGGLNAVLAIRSLADRG